MGEATFELNTLLFESTFKISQPLSATTETVGTTFVLGRPLPSDPTHWRYVLVTAKHVLEDMPGDFAQWHLRAKGPEGKWKRHVVALQIRDKGTPAWRSHSSADVAAMYVSVPFAIPSMLPMAMLAGDEVFQKFEIHPGDGLNCLGFPMGRESNDAGFPVLRSGKIASYPLHPSDAYPTYMFDFEVFGGNSGGPVYLVESNRNFGGNTVIGKVQFIAGLVSQQAVHVNERLALSIVVHSRYIVDTINLLPTPVT